MSDKPILCLDFDGVIHSYVSGWQGARNIPDPPVDGALEFIVTALHDFEVHIFSSRSHQFGGRRAMKNWLHHHLCLAGLPSYEDAPGWLRDHVVGFGGLYDEHLHDSMWGIVKQIKWPKNKPAAQLTIDDRVHCFTGEWPSFEYIKGFRPWNKPVMTPTPPMEQSTTKRGEQ